MKKKLVLKIGTSTLTAGTKMISRGKIEDIGRQIMKLRDEYDIVLVSSGAVATARQFINLQNSSNPIVTKQALAAIGQPLLMHIYNEVFGDFGIQTAQCLLTYEDFQNNTSRVNVVNTINELLINNFVPIINENDTTSVSEIKFGDNDKLSAHVANLIDADLLVIASDIDGVYDKNPHIHQDARLVLELKDIELAKNFIEEKDSGLGTGGMSSKLQAGNICKEKNIDVWIVNGGRSNFLIDALDGNNLFTKISNKDIYFA